jgi:hypothetical protein
LARRKSRSQLLRYFQYNLFFAVLTWALAQIGIELGYNIPVVKSTTTVLESVRDFFLVPFPDGHQYLLYLAAWFILQLYLVHLLFQAVMWSVRRGCVLAVLALTIPVTLPILIWHFTIFLLINVALFAAGLVTFKDLSNNGFILNPKQTWLLYEVPALLAPLWIDRGIGWLAMRVGLSRDGSF